jgi:hypothetical protein
MIAPAFSGGWFSEKRSIFMAGKLFDHYRGFFPNRCEEVRKCIDLMAENDTMF